MLNGFLTCSVNALVVTAILATTSCKNYADSDPKPAISDIPEIELVSVSETSVHQLSDSIVFTIRYTDGNGDLGFASADSMSVELTDQRFPLTFMYHLQPLAPEESDMVITGLLPVVLQHTILQNENAASEQATFGIRLKDRAGNWSNTITTPAITVLP